MNRSNPLVIVDNLLLNVKPAFK